MAEQADRMRFLRKNKGFAAGAGAISRRGLVQAGLGAIGAAALPLPALSRPEARIWTLAAMEDFPPYNYYSGQNFIGIDVEIISEASRLLGLSLQIRPLPWPRAILTFKAGGADGIFQLAPTRDRFAFWNMAGPMRPTRLSFAVRAEDPRVGAEVAAARPGAGGADRAGQAEGRYDIARLAGHRIGVVNGFTYTPEFDTADSFVREGSIDDLTSLRKLLLGRVTTVLGGAANLRFAADRLGVRDRVHILAPPLAEVPRYVGFRRDAAGDQKSALMRAALHELRASGQVDRILARHGEL